MNKTLGYALCCIPLVVLSCLSALGLNTAVGHYAVQMQIGVDPEKSMYMISNLAVDLSGRIYAVDGVSAKVNVYDGQGEYVMTFGGPGKEAGRFAPLGDQAILGQGFDSTTNDGVVYIADPGNGRVQKFASGQLESTIGDKGPESSRLKYPTSITLDKAGDLYVLDSDDKRVKKYDASGRHTLTITPPISEGEKTLEGTLMRTPGGIGFLGAHGEPMRVYKSDGSQSASLKGLTGSYSSVSADPAGRIVYVDGMTGSVVVRDATGNTAVKWAPKNSGADAERLSAGATAGPNGTTYVFDKMGRTVYRLTPGKAAPETVLSIQPQDGQLSVPEDVVTAPDGNVWVADSGNRRIQVFGPDGAFLAKIPTSGVPLGIALDNDGNAYVSTEDPISLLKIGPARSVIPEFSKRAEAAGVLRSGGKVIVADRMIYVCDDVSGAVQVFDAKGGFRRKLQGFAPMSLAPDGKGGLYVGDGANGRVLRFNRLGKLIKATSIGGTGKTGKQLKGSFAPGALAITRDGILALNVVSGSLDLIGPGGKITSTQPVTTDSGLKYGLGGMTISKDGTIFVADTLKHRVLALTKH
jgi:WD40 repeat protein